MPVRLFSFVRNYYLFVIAAAALIVGLVLQFAGLAWLAHWILGVVALGETLPLLWDMWQDLREGTYGVDILAATAIITSVIMQQFWAGIVVVLMLTGGEALEDYASHRAKTELDALLKKAPKRAHLLKAGKETDIAASAVNAGDRLIIKPGEVVPVDAVVVEGSASVDESSLTGESLPQPKDVNDELLSGSVNLDAALIVKALRPAADSQYEQIIKLVQAASSGRSPFVRLADRYSIPFTITAFVIAGAAWIISGQSIRFLEVLVVATPCPLILAAPIAIISGMSRAARHGIIIKSGGALERLAESKTIAFDKTGTLTKGNFVVDSVKTFGDYGEDQVLGLAAAMEQGSNHVLARAIIEEATKQKLKLPKVKGIKEESGTGLVASERGRQVLVGRQLLLDKYEVVFPSAFKPAGVKQTATLVAIDGQLAGIINFRDEIRPESKLTLKALKSLGARHLLMVTGDNQTIAQTIAKQLGIDEVRAEALPADKLRTVEKLPNRPVVFVGDGVNDAPVLMASDVGIALGARGETAASESADMVILLDDVSRVATVLSVAKRTFSVARQSILVGIALSVILMFIFSTGHFAPLYGAIIQELVDVVVIFNALRAHTGKLAFATSDAK